jgi:F-type H+-transporting ATPase subunit delta
MAAEVTHETVLEAGSVRARIARVYAEALLGAAMKQSNADAVDSVGEEMNELVSGVFGRNPTVAAFLGSPAVGRKTKTAALEAALPGRSSELLRGLFAVLAHNGRLDLFAGIAAAYHDLIDKRSGRVRVKVTAAAALSETQRAALSSTLAELLKQQPMLQVRVDPELLGGMIVQVGDRVIDTSVRTRLHTLRTLLLDKGSTNVVKTNS